MRILFRRKYVRPLNNVTSSLSESFRSDSELTASTSDYSRNISAVPSKTYQHQEGDPQQFTLFRLNNKSEDTDHTLSKSSLLGDSSEYTTTDCKTDTESHENDVHLSVNDFDEECNRCLFAKNWRKQPMRLDKNAPSSPKMKPSLEELRSLKDNSVSDGHTTTTEVVLLRDSLPEFKCTDSTASTGIGMRKIHALSESNGMATSVGRSVLHVPNLTSDAIKEAKRQAEHALQNGKIFAVFGPYNRVRLALRTRGWVEKFYRSASATRSRDRSRVPAITGRKRKSVSLDRQTFTDVDDSLPAYPDDEYSDYPSGTLACSEAECKVPPWLEKDGYYALLIGLCRHLRQIRWVDEVDSDTFFPRCFILSEDEDKQAFIEEFRLTACMSLLKLTCSVLNPAIEDPKCPPPTDVQKESGFGSARTSASSFLSTDSTFSKMTPRSTFSTPNHLSSDCSDGFELPGTRAFHIPPWTAQNPLEKIPHNVIDMAIARCQYFIRSKFHWDIDQPLSNLSDKGWPWDTFLTWHYVACKLEDLLRIMQSSISFGECRFVVQKYIERPLLVHKTKFDIRQWFLVTDWSPLTVWWYRDCYLRFCSQEFTLDDFSEAIHLSNNSIQHKYENGTRSERLPQENMWTLEEFQQWLLEEGHNEIWGKQIEPSMKRAIISTLLCAQEVVEPRKVNS
ncbi:hypothetical protein AHF37_04599 [Paragonimus kellicotti]|nr:hypothetical protein AHF37_04599 [Paragonimus kellicotti]